MNLLDLLLAVILGISVATGFMAGFARVGVGFIASISGLIFGFWYYNVPATWMREHWTNSCAGPPPRVVFRPARIRLLARHVLIGNRSGARQQRYLRDRPGRHIVCICL